MATSTASPIANDTDAAGKVPIVFPSFELIGACMATRPPATHVARTGPHFSITWPRASSGPRRCPRPAAGRARTPRPPPPPPPPPRAPPPLLVAPTGDRRGAAGRGARAAPPPGG